MAVVQNLYEIFKISSTKIVENELDIENYTKKQAAKEGAIVSVGDNLVFHKIRDYHKDNRSHVEIFNEVQKLRKVLKLCKKEGKAKEARIVNQEISKVLFVRDIINVEVLKKKEYKLLANGFYVNGVRYVRLCCGAGALRRNTVTFINEDLFDYVNEALLCKVDKKIDTINIGKFNAYYALAFSSVLWVREPRVCVVKDFETVIKDQKIDFIYKKEDGTMDIEERVMDVPMNSADGQGLVDPEFAQLWGQDMFLDYTPSSFVIRGVFVKGNVVPFDFKAYAKENEVTTIKDRWGTEYPVDEIDILLSESQFKMHKYYDSWQEYLVEARKHKMHWGVTRYNKKIEDEDVLTNYQYLQCLDVTKEDILDLVKPTKDWLHAVCSGDLVSSLLFLYGNKSGNVDFKSVYGSAQTIYTKAILKNNDMLKDSFVRRKIYNNIVESINKAKIGKIWVKGNYQFMISDPVAQCRSALGLSPDGLIPADHVYNHFWNERPTGECVGIARSPMIDDHEHNPSKLYSSTEAKKWYQHIHSGIIFSIYDTAVNRMEDADFDGDLAAILNNKYFINNAQKHRNIIMYDKESVSSQKITHNNMVKMEIKGFGTKVGSFSNCATIIEAMRGMFLGDKYKDQYEVLTKRKQMLREIVGNEIDSAKGLPKPSLPKDWKKYEKINKDDDDATKALKYKHNSLVISKKPYFFRYLYPELNNKFKQYESAYNIISKDMFGIKFKKLMAQKEKTEDQLTLIRRYQKYSPLIVSPCSMNIICKEFENTDFDIKYKGDGENMLPLFEDEFKVDKKIFEVFKKTYRSYNNNKSIKIAQGLFTELNSEDQKEIRVSILRAMSEESREILFGLKLTPKEIMFYIGQVSKEYSNFNWGFAWDMLEEFIVDLIPAGQSQFPIESEEGVDCLGRNYSLIDLKQEEGEENEQ